MCSFGFCNNEGLSSGVDEKSLKEAFSSFGDVTEGNQIKIIMCSSLKCDVLVILRYANPIAHNLFDEMREWHGSRAMTPTVLNIIAWIWITVNTTGSLNDNISHYSLGSYARWNMIRFLKFVISKLRVSLSLNIKFIRTKGWRTGGIVAYLIQIEFRILTSCLKDPCSSICFDNGIRE